jgi:hypothetical protein
MLRDINGNKFRTRWISEFCGFMWGDGYIGIVKYHKKDKEFFRGQVSIQLREDDISILKEIESKLGGHIWKAKPRSVKFIDGKEYQQNQTYGWISINRDELRRIVDVLEQGMFPSKKKQNIKFLKRYLKISEDIYRNPVVKEEANELRLKCIQANKYNELVTH